MNQMYVFLYIILQPYYGYIRIMYTVGYSMSLVALVLALGILIFFRYYLLFMNFFLYKLEQRKKMQMMF